MHNLTDTIMVIFILLTGLSSKEALGELCPVTFKADPAVVENYRSKYRGMSLLDWQGMKKKGSDGLLLDCLTVELYSGESGLDSPMALFRHDKDKMNTVAYSLLYKLAPKLKEQTYLYNVRSAFYGVASASISPVCDPLHSGDEGCQPRINGTEVIFERIVDRNKFKQYVENRLEEAIKSLDPQKTECGQGSLVPFEELRKYNSISVESGDYLVRSYIFCTIVASDTFRGDDSRMQDNIPKDSSVKVAKNNQSSKVDELISKLDDPNKKIQYDAALQLGQLGPVAAKAVPKLSDKLWRFLSEPSKGYQDLATARAASQALGLIGVKDSMVVNLLNELANWARKEDPQLLDVVEKSLNQLR